MKCRVLVCLLLFSGASICGPVFPKLKSVVPYGIISLGGYVNIQFGRKISFVPGLEASYFFYGFDFGEKEDFDKILLVSTNIGLEKNFKWGIFRTYAELQATHFGSSFYGGSFGTVYQNARRWGRNLGIQSTLWTGIILMPDIRITYIRDRFEPALGVFAKAPLLYAE